MSKRNTTMKDNRPADYKTSILLYAYTSIDDSTNNLLQKISLGGNRRKFSILREGRANWNSDYSQTHMMQIDIIKIKMFLSYANPILMHDMIIWI